MSNTNIITRDFAILGNNFPIRIVELNGQPWFVALDLAAALGFTIDNLKYHAKQTFAGEEKRVVKLPGFRGNGVLTISESGLYKLIMRSDKPQARLFQDWVTRDVLPAIRKDGAYIMGEEKVATGEMDEDEFVLKAINILQKKVERLKEENKQLTVENKVMADELNILTVDEYRALRHLYLTKPQKAKLSNYAKNYCLSKGIAVTKQERFLPNIDRNVVVNVYPREALDHAALVLGL